ncbi:MAG: sigma-70 family RNA polymerase sigma factor [Bryobacteraceae bacterium]
MEAVQPAAAGEVTRLLNSWGNGDHAALERLTPLVYSELRRLARRNFAVERAGHLLQPSALVNEAFLRLIGGTPTEWSSRRHFFAFSARLMRQILIDFARAQDTDKRGHRRPHADLSQLRDRSAAEADPVDLIDLDTALDELAALNARHARIVELRYFGGLENTEIADVLGISDSTVVRNWRLARAWLFDRLKPPAQESAAPERS